MAATLTSRYLAVVIMSQVSSRVAPYFRTTNPQDVRIIQPYEVPGKVSQWVRGSIRHNGTDLVVTGPKLRVCFSGCRWNKLVLGVPALVDDLESTNHDVVEAIAFKNWLHELAGQVQATVWAQPEKFKPGAKSSTRFIFDTDYVKPSSDPSLYPDEVRCRLSTYRQTGGENENYDVVDADLFKVVDGIVFKVDAPEIFSGSYVIPVLKINYFRNIERFGLMITVLKAHVFPQEYNRIGNDEWVVDYSSNA